VRFFLGATQVTLSMRAEGEASLALHQLVVALERLELVQPAGPVAAAPALTVVRVTPTVTVVKDRDDLLAGLEQHIQLVIKTGSTPFNQVRSPSTCQEMQRNFWKLEV